MPGETMKLIILLISLLPSLAMALPTVIIDGNIVITPPTAMTDGSPVTGTITYRLYCKSGLPEYLQTDMVIEGTPSIISIASLGLTGSQVCASTAMVAEGESNFSNQVNFTCSDQCLSGRAPMNPVIRVE